MPVPVVLVEDGAPPVTNAPTGAPCTPVEAHGMPVVLVESGGRPVALVNEDLSPWEPDTGAPALVDVSVTTYGSRANTTIAAPEGAQSGGGLYLLLFIGAAGGAPVPTPPEGFEAIGEATTRTDAATFNGRLWAWSGVHDGSESYTVTHSAASTQAALVCIENGGSVDAESSNVGTTGPTTATGVTTTDADDLLIYAAHDWEGGGALNPPSGFDEHLDGLLYVATKVQPETGATGDVTQVNANVENLLWGAKLIAVKA